MINVLPTDKQAKAALLAVETEDSVFRFVCGLRGDRKAGVTTKQIQTYHAKFPDFTNPTAVEEAIDELNLNGKIRIVARHLKSHRRANGAYVYVKEED